MIGPISWVDSLGICCMDAPCSRCSQRESIGQLGAVAFTDESQPVLPEVQEFSYKVKRWQVDQSGCCPVLQPRINVDWLTFDPQMFAPLFPRLYNGILHDLFIQKAAVASNNASSSRMMVSLLLPGHMEADQWLRKVRANRHMWPLQMTSHSAANQLTTEIFMRTERRRLQARHIWKLIPPKLSQDGIPPTMTSGDGTAVSSGPPARWEAPPLHPAHILYLISGRPRTRTSVSENPVGALLLVSMPLLTQPGEFFHLCKGLLPLLPGYSGMKWVSSRILFELSGSKAACLSSIGGCCIVATTRTTMVFLSRTASSTGTWVNQLATLVQQLG